MCRIGKYEYDDDIRLNVNRECINNMNEYNNRVISM